MTSVCPACGNGNLATASFCDECGGALAIVPPPAGSPRRSASRPRTITIGRDPDNDVVLDFPMISGRHARIAINGGQASIEDLHSTNGTAIGAPDRKIARSPLSPGETVYFGSFPMPASRLLGGPVSLGNGPQSTLHFSGGGLLLGRAPDCSVVLDYPTISWHHARVTRSGRRVSVEDLGSTNGTFLNGDRLSHTAAVHVGDVIGLGSYSFRLTGLDTIEQRDLQGNVAIEAQGVAVEVAGKRLIDAVSLVIYPSELVGLMGPSGAGKTTLMSALNGYVRPTAGAVLFNSQDLYTNYGQFRMQIGYVPQDDIMHRDLTVQQALYYAARLRLPRDMKDAEINSRIVRVLAQLGLAGTENVLIGSPEKKGISGGQRKRVNLAMELLTEPFVFFLDEPTSGLSSEDALVVMNLLRAMADAGKTVLLTIHQPSRQIFSMFDNALLLAKYGSASPGRIAYFGPAYPEAVTFFEPAAATAAEPSPDLILSALLSGLARRPPVDWVGKYEASPYKRRYVDERLGAAVRGGGATAAPAARRSGGMHQAWTLARRSLTIKARDVGNTAVLLAQAPVIALLIVLVFGREVRATPAGGPRMLTAASNEMTVLFLMVVAAIWFGCSNSAREIVGEAAIFQRERMINLTLPAYVASKLAVLGGICVVQCALLLGIVHLLCRLPGSAAPMLAVLLCAAAVGVALGLLISALARSSEVAIALVPLALLPMVILGGMMQPLHRMETPVRWLAGLMPARWAFEGLALIDNAGRQGDMMSSFFPAAGRSSLPAIVATLLGMLLLLICGTGAVLRSRDLQ